MASVNDHVAEQILQTLQQRDPAAAFVTEVAAAIRPAPRLAEIEDALRDLDASGQVLVMQHTAPDIHLESLDLRVVACASLGGDANQVRAAAESVWEGWLRVFLANHRCE
jgi:phosphoglycerate dehydrogenase-like enzyme